MQIGSWSQSGLVGPEGTNQGSWPRVRSVRVTCAVVPASGHTFTAATGLASQVQSFDYSCIVFDTAPTGHTLRLLQARQGKGCGLAACWLPGVEGGTGHWLSLPLKVLCIICPLYAAQHAVSVPSMNACHSSPALWRRV